MISNEEAKVNIALNVRHLLATRQPPWSQAQLARATKENVMTISHVARGRHLPSAALLARIAEVLETTSEVLLSDPPERIREKSA